MKKLRSLNYRKPNTQISIRFLGLVGIVLFSLIPVSAQTTYSSATDGSTPSGMATGAAGGNFDSVNFYNGNLNFQLPLLTVGGRGSAQTALNFSRNSKSWHVKHSHGTDQSGNPVTGNTADSSDWYGNPGFAPGTMGSRQVGGTWKINCQAPGGGIYRNINKITLTRLVFTSPDGTQTELRDQLTDGEPKITEDPCTPGFNTFNRGKVFVSRDGSRMKFISDTDILDYSGGTKKISVSGFLYLANGTTMRIDGYISWILDRNGNKLTYLYDSLARPTTITDSLGRQTTIVYNETQPGSYKEIQFSGFGGVQRTIRISGDTLGNCLRNGEILKSPDQLFPELNNPNATALFNPPVASSVTLSDGKQYRFYYNSYGELARVTLPTGGAIEYDHTPGSGVMNGTDGKEIYRRIVERRVYSDAADNNSLVGKMTVGSNTVQGSVEVKQIAPNGTVISRELHYYYGDPVQSIFDPSEDPTDYGSWTEGREYQTRIFKVNTDGSYTEMQRVMTEYEQSQPIAWQYSGYSPPSDPRLKKQVSITIENGTALAILKKTEYDDTGSSDPDYFSHLNVKRSKAYNYKVLDLNTAQNADIDTIAGMFTESDLASVSETHYLYDAGYKSRHILGLPFETRVMNPASPTQILAKSQIVFDEQGQYYSMADYGSTLGYEAPTGTYAHLRGNATTYRTWFAEENRWIETHTQYDNFGNMRKAWDSSGDPNRFVETEYSSQYYYAYPTKKITKGPGDGTHGTTENSTITAVYDFWTGLITSVIDDTGQVTTTEYDDLLRPKKVIPPAGGGISEKIYGDTPGNLFVTTKTQVDAQNWAETTAFLDNLGRVYKTQTKDRQGDIFADVEYDSFGRVARVSNPYRQGEQKYWSKPRYDNQGRVVETFAPAPDGQTGASMGTVEFGISTIPGLVGNYVTATDASGRMARSLTNVYGQTVRVDEPTGNNDLGPLDNPNQASYYTYNVKGELVIVKQGNQNQTCGTTAQCRYFMYDSLGRLIRVRQPEQMPHASLATSGNPDNNQWTAGFTYDVFGNVTTVKDANGLTITNEYDKAGRVTKSSYSDGTTPQSEYFYDGTGLGLSQAPPFSKGSLTKISNGVSETRYTSFDNYGRVLANQQITDGQTHNFGYKYDSIGNLTEETYPSGRVVKTLLDTDGGLAAVSSKVVNGSFKTYASNFDYTVTGNIKAMMLGNGRWETAAFNERHQATQIGLGSNAADTSLWKVNYDYGELNADGSVDAGKNIGMVAKQTITLPTMSFVQTYKYDALNRLTEAKENANTTSGAENWKQTFGYDRFGNRTDFYQKVGSNVLPINNITKPQIDPATNRFTTGQGYVYDFNGNLVQDAENRQFTYDGDDKQTVVRDLNIPTTTQNPDANVIGRYYYDGEGKRVKKVTNFETTIFVYDGAGALVAEYSTQTNPEPTTSYLTTDNLGSPRVVTDKNGNVISRRDFMPFGEELIAGVGARDTNQKYSATGIDNIRQRFTGYEKDIETDLDFAEARMYKNSHGRFTAPDPLLSSASLDNPQTFNRYVYVGNNPINLTDPSGLKWCQDPGSTAFTFTGPKAPCNSEFPDDITGQEITITQGSVTTIGGYVAVPGDKIRLNADGSATLVSIGRNKTEQVDVQIQQASDPAVQVSPGDSTLGTTISQQLIPLPCPEGQTCSSSPPPPPRLDTKNVPPLETVAAIESVVEILQVLPVVGTAATVIKITIDVGQGDFSEAGENVVGFIPLGKVISREKRWVELATEINSRLPKEVVNFIKRHKGKKVTEKFGLELAHPPKRSNAQGFDFSEAKPKTSADHRGIEHRYLRERKTGTKIGIPKRGTRGKGKLSLPKPGKLPR